MSGVVEQMTQENIVARAARLPWTSRFYGPPGSASEIYVDATSPASNRLAFKRDYYAWLDAELDHHDILLLRYSGYDPFQLLFLKQCRLPVFLVHHTLEGPEFASRPSWTGRLQAVADEFLGSRSIRHAAGIVAVTSEIADYEQARSDTAERPRVLYPNGVLWTENEPVDNRGEAPDLLMIASYFAEWHGADRLIASAISSHSDFVLNLVGDYPTSLRDLVGRDPRIRFHGRRNRADLQQFMSKSWLGLSSFALDRKRMYEACTLKVREYLQHGLPVYAGHRDVFTDDFAYYRNGACDIDAILEFARDNRSISRPAVRDASRPWIDKRLIIERVYADVVRAVTGRGDG